MSDCGSNTILASFAYLKSSVGHALVYVVLSSQSHFQFKVGSCQHLPIHPQEIQKWAQIHDGADFKLLFLSKVMGALPGYHTALDPCSRGWSKHWRPYLARSIPLNQGIHPTIQSSKGSKKMFLMFTRLWFSPSRMQFLEERCFLKPQGLVVVPPASLYYGVYYPWKSCVRTVIKFINSRGLNNKIESYNRTYEVNDDQ